MMEGITLFGGTMFSNGLWIILLEVLLALALAVFIVWWTRPTHKRPQRGGSGPDEPA